MARPRMHPDELDVDVRLVRRLVAEQFPQWAHLSLTPVASSGTVNALYRLGDDKLVRLPLTLWGAESVEREHEWLPRLTPLLPVEIPVVVGQGLPGLGYLCPWSVFAWIEGDHPMAYDLADPHGLAGELASLIHAFHGIDLPDPPPAYRGPVAEVDDQVRQCISGVADEFDSAALIEAWDSSATAPEWDRPPVWAHSDLLASNLLVRDGHLAAVLDFGNAGIGDPACDLMVAWNVLPAGARETFRQAVGLDDATWLRGRGWALAQAVIALPYYRDTNPGMSTAARHVLREVLSDLQITSP